MDAKRLLTGSIVGGVAITALGFPLYEFVLGGFFDAQTIVETRATPIWWAAIASSLVYGALLTLVLGWAGASTGMEGLKIGALFGVLVWLGADLILYGLFEFTTLAGALVDAVASAVPFGGAGAAIAAAARSAPKVAAAAT